MFIEEMMTATLLPLAQQYVQYCRRHQQHPENRDGRLWTLPPEEAVMKLYDYSNSLSGSSSNVHVGESVLSSSLLSTRIPTRSCVSGAIGTSLLNQPSRTDHERIVYNNWCRTTAMTTMISTTTTTNTTNSKMQQQWIENDASFFQILIQNIPTTTTTTKTIMNTADTFAFPASQRPAAANTTTPIANDNFVATDHVANEI